MRDFVCLEGINGEEVVLQRSQISSINSAKGQNISTIIMINGTEFDVVGNAQHLMMYEIGTKML